MNIMCLRIIICPVNFREQWCVRVHVANEKLYFSRITCWLHVENIPLDVVGDGNDRFVRIRDQPDWRSRLGIEIFVFVRGETRTDEPLGIISVVRVDGRTDWKTFLGRGRKKKTKPNNYQQYYRIAKQIFIRITRIMCTLLALTLEPYSFSRLSPQDIRPGPSTGSWQCVRYGRSNWILWRRTVRCRTRSTDVPASQLCTCTIIQCRQCLIISVVCGRSQKGFNV